MAGASSVPPCPHADRVDSPKQPTTHQTAALRLAGRTCQTFPSAVAEKRLVVAQSGMAVALRARGRCPVMRDVSSTEAARRDEWSAATLRIHTERDGRCGYCSERGSADPWPCLMARLAMHAKAAVTPAPGNARERRR